MDAILDGSLAGRPYTTLHVAVREPRGHHTKEVRRGTWWLEAQRHRRSREGSDSKLLIALGGMLAGKMVCPTKKIRVGGADLRLRSRFHE